jgi:hypothetical protein
VASAVEPPNQETLHEIAQTPSPPTRTEFGLRRVPVPAEVITLAVRWYLRFALSSRDVEELPSAISRSVT